MTPQDIQTMRRQIEKWLNDRNLQKALEYSDKLYVETGAGIFGDKLNDLRATYKQLLYYYAEGFQDPMRQKIYNTLLASAYELHDGFCRKQLLQSCPDLHYAIRREILFHSYDMQTVIDTVYTSYYKDDYAAMQSEITNLFNHVWTADFLSDNEEERLRNMLTGNDETSVNPQHDEYLKTVNCQIVSALTLGLQEFFDKKKLGLLFDAAENPDDEIKMRAYIGILLTLYVYRRRIDCYPEIELRMGTLSEIPDFKRIIYIIIRHFILSRETEKISDKMKNEIYPEMIKIHKQFTQELKTRNLPNSETDKIELPDMNPEWLEQLSSSPLANKLEEINRWQEEGADIMHGTFAQFKGFSFFESTGNWFMPFCKGLSVYPHHGAVADIALLMADVGHICNSDLFSLYLGMSMAPENEQKKIFGGTLEQLKEYAEQIRSDAQANIRRLECAARQYVQDLYRFYKLHPRRYNFNDIFDLPLDFHNIPVMRRYLYDEEYFLKIADSYLHKNYFNDALTIYNDLTGTPDNAEMLYQKKGYCQQMTGNYKGALDEYFKAELINPASKWLLRRIAQCYRAERMPEKAVEYYKRYEKAEPENIAVLLNIGACYLEKKDYTAALKYYFKADYLDADSGKAWRPIAWCLFLAGKYEQARKYYEKILASDNPDAHDYLNAGHVELATKDVKKALALYAQSIRTVENDFDSFDNLLRDDLSELTAAGVPADDIALVTDWLRYYK